MISFSHVFLSLFVAIIIANDRESSFITRLYTTPLKSYEFILGYSLSVIPIGLIQTSIILLISGLLDPNFLSWNLILCIPFSLVSISLFVGFGLLFGTLFNVKTVGGVASILIICQSLLSGMWFPLDKLSDGFNRLIEVLPFKAVLYYSKIFV